ncbi:MAG: hypothetical protein R3E01_33800 [Pirellulaceae bacterium]|nr:hypothetical protein [Planctomycetales bacterium]
MARFQYEAADTSGTISHGEIVAESIQHATDELRMHGLDVRFIHEAEADLGQEAAEAILLQGDRSTANVSHDALITRYRDLRRQRLRHVTERRHFFAPAIQAYAHDIAERHSRRNLQSVAKLIEDLSERNENDWDAMIADSNVPAFWVNQLAAWGPSQNDLSVLDDIISLSREETQRKKGPSHLQVYLLTIGAIAIAIFVAISFVVMPTFESIFSSFAFELPWLTWYVIRTAQVVRATWGLVLIGPYLLLTLGLSSRRWLRWVGLSRDNGAIFGMSQERRTSVAQWLQVVGCGLRMGLGNAEAVVLAGDGMSSSLRADSYQLSSAIASGNAPVDFSERRSSIPYAARLILDSDIPRDVQQEAISELRRCYLEFNRRTSPWMFAGSETLCIFVVGLLVALVFLALFAPLVGLVSNLS